MSKNKIINISVVLLCVITICINSFFDQYKAIGATCMLFMGVLALYKERLVKKNN